MINQPPVDLLIEQLGTPEQPVSRYCLCVVAAKRARQIIEQTAGTATGNEIIKELAVASREIAEGKIKCVKD
ncbi:MAG: DNA-directed RNA polymerase subunit omega [Clostridiales bacterium]|nr:DNA-directed RNA polymerase subunit omega [Clostridiales bacterium]MCH5148003.1 DNA-directed RNA polymerase subunit omega [Clostridiales bacterium]